MTADQLADIRDRKTPLTGRLTVALADTLLSVLDACGKDSAHLETHGPDSSWIFGFKTFQRVAASRILEAELP